MSPYFPQLQGQYAECVNIQQQQQPRVVYDGISTELLVGHLWEECNNQFVRKHNHKNFSQLFGSDTNNVDSAIVYTIGTLASVDSPHLSHTYCTELDQRDLFEIVDHNVCVQRRFDIYVCHDLNARPSSPITEEFSQVTFFYRIHGGSACGPRSTTP